MSAMKVNSVRRGVQCGAGLCDLIRMLRDWNPALVRLAKQAVTHSSIEGRRVRPQSPVRAEHVSRCVLFVA